MDKFVAVHAAGCVARQDAGRWTTTTATPSPALWNYAQHFAMSDNSFGTTFGPSTPGRAEPRLRPDARRDAARRCPTSPKTARSSATPTRPTTTARQASTDRDGADRQERRRPAERQGRHLGLVPGRLRADQHQRAARRSAAASHTNIGGATVADYSPHHEPFQYYAVDRPTRTTCRRARSSMIGKTDQANHQYDLSRLLRGAAHATSCRRCQLPEGGQVPGRPRRLLRPAGRAGLRRRTRSTSCSSSPDWSNTAVVIAYDDSDGWYDHVMRPIVNSSASPQDALNGPGKCGNGTPAGGYRGSLRLRPAAAAAGGLAVGEAQLRRPHDHRPDLDPALHRGQLGPRPHRRRLVRRASGLARRTCSTSTHATTADDKLFLNERPVSRSI